jgi:acetolactate synthase-1/2/3 large subunit
MHGQELATAVQQQLAVIFIVANNSQYATIRMHQARRYRGRPVGTALQNPEFAALARAYGAHGERIEKTEDFAAAFERARAANGPALIELICDPGRLTPTLRIEDLEPVEQGGQVTVTGEVTA